MSGRLAFSSMRNKASTTKHPVSRRMAELGYIQTDLARRSKVPDSVISHLVTGLTKVPSLHTALRLARALQLETIGDVERLFPKPRKAKVVVPASEISGA